MDTPRKSYVPTKGKAKSMPMGKGKHTTNPTTGDGNTKAKMGVPSLDGAHGNKGKYC